MYRGGKGNPGITRTTSLSYDEQRIAWRAGLSDSLVREFASEYLRGDRDEDICDGYAEYQARFEQPISYGLGVYGRRKKARRSR